jgi:hypothetical protein
MMIKKYATDPLRSTATFFFVITAVALSLVACGSRAREVQPAA